MGSCYIGIYSQLGTNKIFSKILEANDPKFKKILKKCFLGITCIVFSLANLELQSHTSVLPVSKWLTWMHSMKLQY